MNHFEAFVPDAKIDYLLTDETKRGLFLSLGYTVSHAEELRQGLLAIIRTQPIISTVETEYGTIYNIVGYLNTPKRGMFAVRTGWMVEANKTAPRFLTAFPQRG